MRALLDAQRLLALDELWTQQLNEAATARASSETAHDQLLPVVAEITELLATMTRHAFVLEKIVASVSQQAFDRCLQALANEPPTRPQIASLPSELVGLTPSAAVTCACNYVQANAEDERRVLWEQLDELARGNTPPGDLQFPFRCALSLLCVGAGVVATIGLGGAVSFVTAAVAAQVGDAALGWSAAKCPPVLGKLRGLPRQELPAAPPEPPPVSRRLATIEIVQGDGWIEVGGVRIRVRPN